MTTYRVSLTLALLLAAVSASAQEQEKTDTGVPKLRLFRETEPARPFIDFGEIRVFTETNPSDLKIPNWRVGLTLKHDVWKRLQVSGTIAATRGSQGPTFLFREIGSGRDLSVRGPLTGPGSYKTQWDTTFTATVPLKTTGRLKLDVVGEVWNPFTPTKTPAPVLIPKRGFRLGIVGTY